MSFVKSTEWLMNHPSTPFEFYEAEQLTVIYETKPEIIEKLLPPPLKPTPWPVVTIGLANFPSTNFGCSYLESFLHVSATYNNEMGVFIVAMPVTDGMGLIYGRELIGYPKKMAEIELKRSGNEVSGWTKRHGITFMELRAKLTGKYIDSYAEEILTQILKPPMDLVIFNFKYFFLPDGTGFDYNPRLIRQVGSFRPEKIEVGEADIILKPSEYDPWSDIEIVRMLGAVYTVGNNTLPAGTIVAEADPVAFLPYAFMGFDSI